MNWFVLRAPQLPERKFTYTDASQTALVFSCLGAKEVAYATFCKKSTRKIKAPSLFYAWLNVIFAHSATVGEAQSVLTVCAHAILYL